METVCRLCGNTEELCRSHILPEFLYRPLYDEKHRYSILTKGIEKKKYGQRGLTERLLCGTCEQHLCTFEGYAAKVISGQLGHRAERRGSHIVISGIEYTRFKLFLLSILWRASVSTLDFFYLVSLGPREETLRKLLLAGDPGSPDEFGCVVTFIHDRGSDMSDTFINPEPMRWAGRRMYKFVFAGAVWVYNCDRRPLVSHLQKFILRPGGNLTGQFGDFADGPIYGPAAKMLARRWGYA